MVQLEDGLRGNSVTNSGIYSDIISDHDIFTDEDDDQMSNFSEDSDDDSQPPFLYKPAEARSAESGKFLSGRSPHHTENDAFNRWIPILW